MAKVNIEAIKKLVPQGEFFSEDAVGNEGVYLSTAHIASIENALADKEDEADGAAQLNDKIATLETELQTAKNENAGLESKVESLEAEKVNLQNKINELGGKPSTDGKGSTLTAAKDESNDTETPSYLRDNDPANRAADKYLLQNSSVKEAMQYW